MLDAPQPHRAPDAFNLYSSQAAQRYLSQLGLRAARIRVEGSVGTIEADPRDLWRLVARRDEVLARMGELGLRRVSVDLGLPAPESSEAMPFF